MSIEIPRDEEKYIYDNLESMLDRHEHLMDLLAPNDKHREELQELLEIERELTLREEA